MALLSPTDQQTLRSMFDDMTRTVTIVFFTQTIGCETCDETRRILGELTPLTDKIVVEELNLVLDKERAAAYGVDRAPAIALLADRVDTRIRFLGMPAGYDFMALVDAVLAISGASDSELSRRKPRSRRPRHDPDAHSSLRHADVLILSASRRPGEPDGGREPEHQRDDRAGHGVL
jgi:thiol-disulfide isomerase/thioredoxin